jgi:Zn-dependent protease with chaperone function
MIIKPREFIHPEDQAALENLKAVPLFDSFVKAFMKIGIERFLHGISMAEKIRVGPEQLPDIYRHLPPICQTLGIQEPEFYLEMNPMPNAYTQGDTRTFLTVTSGLVEYLNEEELRAVLAHECGHIACRHVLYHTMAQMLAQYGAQMFGPLAMVSAPVRLGLLYWNRRSELSADRAAAVVMKDPKPVAEVMIRLAGGPKSITEKINLELYQQQAEAYDKLHDSQWDEVLQGMAIMNADHPFPAVRTREILKWGASEHFQRIMQALDTVEDAPHCPACGHVIQPQWKHCGYCGAAISVPTVTAGEEHLHG